MLAAGSRRLRRAVRSRCPPSRARTARPRPRQRPGRFPGTLQSCAGRRLTSRTPVPRPGAAGLAGDRGSAWRVSRAMLSGQAGESQAQVLVEGGGLQRRVRQFHRAVLPGW